MAIPDAVRTWWDSLSATDSQETPEPIGEGEDPTTETDDTLNPEPTEDAPTSAETPVDENTDVTGEGEDRTAPEPVSPLTDEDRDGMNTLAAENEALRQENADLRNRIAELGGDAALGIVEEEVVEDLAADADDTDDYDPEADLAEQEAELARLRGE